MFIADIVAVFWCPGQSRPSLEIRCSLAKFSAIQNFGGAVFFGLNNWVWVSTHPSISECNSQWLLRKAALMRFFLSDLHWQALVWGCHSNQISRTKSLWVPRNVTVVPTWKGENPSIAQNFRVRCSLNERTGSVFHINLV